MAAAVYGGSPSRGRNSAARYKRKSAVELLAESKAFYVKSETVLDRTQQMPGCLKPTHVTTQFILVSPSRSLPPPQPRPVNRRSSSAGSDLLQNKLRKLLNCSDSKENVCVGEASGKYDKSANCMSERHHLGPSKMNDHTDRVYDGINIGNCYNTGAGRVYRSDCYKDSKCDTSNVYSSNPLNISQNDRAFFPTTFLSPQSLPPQQMSDAVFCDHDGSPILYTGGGGFNMDTFEMTGKSCDNLILTDDYRAISPPAEYAVTERSSYRCVRSYSHSQPIQADTSDQPFNINSHKSLPDLYSQTAPFLPQLGDTYSIDTILTGPNPGNSNEALSCCSRGTKSNRSDVFSKSNKSSDVFIKSSRSNSSFNRDSGGSSGHYTHRSEPIKKNADYRRDSGSSTQHSGNSAYYDNITYNRAVQRFPNIIETQIDENCVECQALYQDGGYADASQSYENDGFVQDVSLLHFQTPAVPEEFQDNYDASNKVTEYRESREYFDKSNRTSKDGYIYPVVDYQPAYIKQKYSSDVSEPNHCMNSTGYLNTNYRDEFHNSSDEYQDTRGGAKNSPLEGTGELSPPLGTFRRQKCLRIKHRQGRYSAPSTGHGESEDCRPILRSKSDISDRYWQRDKVLKKLTKPPAKSADYGDVDQLERFFEQLGLTDESYDALMLQNISLKTASLDVNEVIECESPVFFSDVSTVDSNRAGECTDYTNTAVSVGNTNIFRPSEPPSIVERNARIIKWLCNCRKLQIASNSN